MAQNFPKEATPLPVKFPWQEEQPVGPNRKGESAAAAVRGGSVVLPLLTRLGSSVGSGIASYVPGIGSAIGSGIAGAGELAAQAMEQGTFTPDVNWGRVAVESALGAVPGSKLMKAGSLMKSAGLGATAAGVGVVGRKLTDKEDPDAIKKWGGSELTQIGIGAGAGGIVGKLASKGAQKGLRVTTESAPKDPPKSFPELLEARLRTLKPEEIEREAARADALGKESTARTIREAAARTKTGTSETYNKLASSRKAGILQEARNLSKAEGAEITQQRAADDILTEAQKQEEKWIKEYQRELAALQKQQNEGAAADLLVQEGQAAKKAEEAAATKVAEAKEGMVTKKQEVRETFRTTDEDGKTTTATKVLGPKGRKKGAPPATPPEKPPIGPKPDVYQIVRPTGQVVEVADEKTAIDLVNAAGPGHIVIPPVQSTAAAPIVQRPPKPTKQPKIKGTAQQATQKLEEQQSAVTPVPAPPPPVKDPVTQNVMRQIAEQDVEARAAIRGTPADVGTDPSALRAEAARQGAFPSEAGLPAVPAKTPDTGGLAAFTPEAAGLKLPAPLAVQTAQALEDVPGGTAIARFFPDRAEALRGAASVEETPENAISTLWPLIGKAETSKAIGKVAAKKAGTPVKDNPLSEAGGKLWNLISKVGADQNVPHLPKGAKPSFKHVPAGQRPTPTSTAPIVDITPPAAAPKVTGRKAGAAKPSAPTAPPPAKTPEGRPYIAPPEKVAGTDVALPGQPTGEAVPGRVTTDLPEAWKPFVEMAESKPVPPELTARLNALRAQQAILKNSGRADSPDMAKLEQEAVTLQQEMFAAQYPELVQELAKADAVAKAAGKVKKPAAPKQDMTPRLNKTKKNDGPKISANPMFDPESFKWAGSQLGAEGTGAVVGGTAGALIDEEDPVRGAMIGAGTGYGLGNAAGRIASTGKPLLDMSGESPIMRALGGFQRFNYLTNPQTLLYNTFLAPQGASVLGSVERYLVGKAEQLAGSNPDAAAKVSQGKNALKSLVGARNFRPQTWKDAWQESQGLIGKYERAEELPQEATSMASEAFTLPGKVMTAGDLVGRGTLKDAGMPDEVARAITVTANPRYRSSEKIVDFSKDPAIGFTFPFARTAVNVLESGLERTPLIGFALRRSNDPSVQATMQELLVRQGMGAAVGYAAYQIGLTTDPTVNRSARVDMLVSNMSGQYGLPAAAGFALGQAVQLGRMEPPDVTDPASWGETLKRVGISYGSNFPLPTTQAPLDVINSVGNYLGGRAAHPNADTTIERMLPRPFAPGIAVAGERVIRSAIDDPASLTRLPWQE